MNKWIGALLACCLLLTSGNALAAPKWVAHASIPGPDTPATGQSRFDQLFSDAGQRYRIPYPFRDLVDFLEQQVDNGDERGVRQVFVPHGRSLQRDAPAPDFFRLPRAVIALQGEPRATPDVLEYRLFIAHQPATETLEIISYNDAAGRFEFQVVDDYAADRQPRVRQANRVMCLSCHQNAAPIFPARPWSETTFNVEVASALTQALPQRFHSLIDTLTADAGAIDLLVERANYLAAAQLIWQRGCADSRCRAAALRAVLQYRLSGGANFERKHRGYRRDYYAGLQRNWQRLWPDGIALGDSRIPDRDPFAGAALNRAHDALALRSPHATWHEVDAIVADGIIFRLASFLTAADIRRIDAHLVAAGGRLAAVEHLRGDCRLAHVAASTRLLECSGNSKAPGLRATLELEYDGRTPRGLNLLSLRVPGDSDILQPGDAGVTPLPDGLRVALTNNDRELSARLANGNRLAALELSWQEQSLHGRNRLEIEIVKDFALLERALATVLENYDVGGGDSLRADPFRRTAIMRDLGRALAMPIPANAAAAQTTRPAIDPPGPGDAADNFIAGDRGLALLNPFCGQCHSRDTHTPPGFLAAAHANARVRQCAARILARLEAWQVANVDAVVPMPPPATIEADWAQSEHYRQLSAAVRALLADGLRDVGVTRAADYDELPPCLTE